VNHFLPPAATVPWIAALRDLIRSRLGYEVPDHRMTLEIAPRVLAYAETHGHLAPQGFVESLRVARDGEDWDALVQVVTVGETYFFRHPEQLAVLADRLQRRSEAVGRPLRIWSAGCATGEEPYSLAMLLAETRVPFELVGTDVDAGALERARAATGFSDRSVAHLPARLRERWLEAMRPGRWRLIDPARLAVRFKRHNLLHDAPLHPAAGGGWDAILCRNVLLYFTPETGAAVIERLGRVLEPGGGLWIGPCDQVAVDPASGLGWRSRGPERFLGRGAPEAREARDAPYRAPTVPPIAEPETAPSRLIERGLFATARRAVEEQVQVDPTDGEMQLLLGAFHLRDHAFEEALGAFDRAARARPKPPGLAYLRGVAHLKAGRSDEAASAFGTALEDDPDDWASSCQLALLYRRAGRALREEVMLLRTLDRLGEGAPHAPDLGGGARLVNSVHTDPRVTRQEVQRRLAALGDDERKDGRTS